MKTANYDLNTGVVSLELSREEITAIARMIGETSEEERTTRFKLTQEESDFMIKLYQVWAI